MSTRVVRYGIQRYPVPCRFCGTEVVWAVTDHRKRMPVDRLPATDGTWVLFWYEEEEPEPVQRVTWVRSLPGYDGLRWLAHWATCPEREAAARHLAEQNRAQGGAQLSLFTGGRR